MSDEVMFDEVQQALVDKLVGEARTKAREKATADAKTAQEGAAAKAKLEAVAAAKEWEKLATMHAARAEELEPFQAQAEAYQVLVEGMLKSKVKTLGDAAKKAVGALPAVMTASEKLEWLNANEELFETVGSGGVGTPGRPKTKVKKGKPEKISKFPIRL